MNEPTSKDDDELSPARKTPDDPPKVHLADEESSDSDEEIDVAEGGLSFLGLRLNGKLRGDWIDRHGTLLIKTFGVVVVAGFMAFVAVRIWGH